MSSEPLRIEVPNFADDPYASLNLMGWWDSERVRRSVALVLGAGALGNEVIKNFAQIGIGRIIIVDFDTVEQGNLSRSALFRRTDTGLAKAEVAAAAAQAINRDVVAVPMIANLLDGIGLGFYRHVDVIVGCVDNQEGRLAINRAAFQVQKDWIDGAILELMGEVRIFSPKEGGCFECQMAAADYRIINARYSCAQLAARAIQANKIPTTPTIAAIIGAIQAQEALKVIHQMEIKRGTAFVYNGYTLQSHTSQFSINEDCLSHQSNPTMNIVSCDAIRVKESTAGDLLGLVQDKLGQEASVLLDFDIGTSLACLSGHYEKALNRRTSHIKDEELICPMCGEICWLERSHSIDETSSFLNIPLAELGMPPMHIVAGLIGENYTYFELTGDYPQFFA